MSAFWFAVAFPGSPKIYRIFLDVCERTTGDANPPGHSRRCQGDGGKVLETHHQTVPECFCQTLTHLEMTSAGLL